ncbi:MAG: HD domain-containing protein [Clostridiaceae bacterium]|nr:HD domain-containing protein [Clostridiaceae bacterium]MDD6074051.1 HD domain-containing protein [Clostridium sp.]
MNAEELLKILSVAEKLKCNTRHCYTSNGRHESVAEHSWRLALMAMLLSGEEEFRQVKMDRVIRMCLIHDLGEAFTGDIPAFEKKPSEEKEEEQILDQWVAAFPQAQKEEFQSLLEEMAALETVEAKLYKALDKLEALIQHNESDLSTWLPLEYELQFTYGQEQMQFSPYVKELRAAVDQWTARKIAEEKKEER